MTIWLCSSVVGKDLDNFLSSDEMTVEGVHNLSLEDLCEGVREIEESVVEFNLLENVVHVLELTD